MARHYRYLANNRNFRSREMPWTVIRGHFSALLAASLQDVLLLHMARYPLSHDFPRRLWFAFRGVEVFTATDIPDQDHQGCYPGSYSIVPLPSQADYPERLIYQAHDGAAACERLIREYPNLTIDEALDHADEFVRALATLDRRLGRRRIASMKSSLNDRPVESFFLRIRIEADLSAQRTRTT